MKKFVVSYEFVAMDEAHAAMVRNMLERLATDAGFKGEIKLNKAEENNPLSKLFGQFG